MKIRSTIYYLKVGLNGDLIPTARLASDKNSYDRMLRSSILKLSAWLNEYVLSGDDQSVGVNVRQRLSEGLVFNEEMHSYLISSYNYWRQRDLVKKRKQKKKEEEKHERVNLDRNKATSFQGHVLDYVDAPIDIPINRPTQVQIDSPVVEKIDVLAISCGKEHTFMQSLNLFSNNHDVIIPEKQKTGCPYGTERHLISPNTVSMSDRIHSGNHTPSFDKSMNTSSISAMLKQFDFGENDRVSTAYSNEQIAVGHADGSIRYYRFDGQGELLTLVQCNV